MAPAYGLRPLSRAFGAIVEGVDLSKPVGDTVREKLKEDLHRNKVLLFRGQGRLSGERQVEISRWFGDLHSTFSKHPRSPHPDVFRVSNDSSEGCTQVGRSGWHIDGTFLETPFPVQIMHFWQVIEGGSTLFSPLASVADLLCAEDPAFWTHLSFVGRDCSHPLICSHPITNERTAIFHFGRGFIRGLAHDERGLLDPREEARALGALQAALERPSWCLEMKWEAGDVAFIDNLAVAHYAVPGTQALGRGTRILHRTTVRGTWRPTPYRDP